MVDDTEIGESRFLIFWSNYKTFREKVKDEKEKYIHYRQVKIENDDPSRKVTLQNIEGET